MHRSLETSKLIFKNSSTYNYTPRVKSNWGKVILEHVVCVNKVKIVPLIGKNLL